MSHRAVTVKYIVSYLPLRRNPADILCTRQDRLGVDFVLAEVHADLHHALYVYAYCYVESSNRPSQSRPTLYSKSRCPRLTTSYVAQ